MMVYTTMIITRDKNCFCHTCQNKYHYMGISRHRKAHKDRSENCKITFTDGRTEIYRYFDTPPEHNGKCGRAK